MVLIPSLEPAPFLTMRRRSSADCEDLPPPHETTALLAHSNTAASSSISIAKTAVIIIAVTCSTFISALVSGMFSVAIPAIAEDVGLDRSLLLWPQGIVSLVSACTLLLAGSISDVIGAKLVYLLGSLLQTCFVLAAGVAQSGTQILVFRGFMGLAQSMCLPTSVSLITNALPPGRPRNIGFACMGGGQPLGFALGLMLGGIFVTTVGWRNGLSLVAAFNATIVIMAGFGLPHDSKTFSLRTITTRLSEEIDWMGVLLISIALGLFSYVLSSISSEVTNIESVSSIVLLCLSVLLIPAFVLWMRHQVRRQRPALIPNALWSNVIFTSTCLCVFFTWGAFNASEQLLSLWMQLVQRLTPLNASIQFLPQTIVGVAVNAAIGIHVHKISFSWVVIASSLISLVAPVLMAVSQPTWSYWKAVFPAMCLNVVGADCLYTISNLIVSTIFPAEEQGLAGAVFNTVAQVGRSVGLTASAVVSELIISHHGNHGGRGDDTGLVEGYQAGFWLCAALAGLSTCVAILGLRRLGNVDSQAK